MRKFLYCMMLLGAMTTSYNFYNNLCACPLKGSATLHQPDKESHQLKDSLHIAISRNNIPEIERMFNEAETERLLLKTKNDTLSLCLSITFVLFIASVIVLFLHLRRKKKKTEYSHLTETIKHSQWGFLVTKEFIAENRIAYDELERMLNRAKGLNDINTEFYNKFHNVLTQQQANYSGRLLNHLSSSNGSFETKFQQQFPDLSNDDLLLATMIHHQWKISDMAGILHISQDAVRKRKMRLGNKLSALLKKELDLDKYLTNF